MISGAGMGNCSGSGAGGHGSLLMAVQVVSYAWVAMSVYSGCGIIVNDPVRGYNRIIVQVCVGCARADAWRGRTMFVDTGRCTFCDNRPPKCILRVR